LSAAFGGAEQRGERLALLDVYEHRKSMAVGILAQMPRGRPGEPPIARDRAGLAMRVRPRLVASASTAGEHDTPIVGRRARMQVGEGAAEAGPTVHLGEQAGDARWLGFSPL
jgi:hypothetical protein